jgi:hypothetical protein
MRRAFWRFVWLLPFGSIVFIGTCGVTGLEMQDFAMSTAIRVGVQTATSVLESGIVDFCTNQGAGLWFCGGNGA